MSANRWPREALPSEAAWAVRAHLPALVDEVIAAIRADSDVYAEVLAGPEGVGIRLGTEQAIRSFLDGVQAGRPPGQETDETWRRLGEAEFQAGRPLEALRAAFRTGTRAAWRNAAGLALRSGLSAPLVVSMAEALFLYADRLAAEVVEGYVRAQSDEAGERERRRRRLAALLLDGTSHDRDTLARAAELARWRLPRTVSAVAIDADAPAAVARRLGCEALAGGDSAGAWLILPDPEGPGRVAALERALAGAGARGALGPAVALALTARSLRWARLALGLRREGLLGPAGAQGSPDTGDGTGESMLTQAVDHLPELILAGDPDLARLLADRALEPLDALPAGERERLAETLAAWLGHQRHTPRIARELHVHPQTVRHRLRRLEALLGERLRSPSGRLELELALATRATLDCGEARAKRPPAAVGRTGEGVS